jgi:mono/diheme cytochrome c family protein
LQAKGAPRIYALFGGDAARGETLFQEHPAAQCIRCHALEGGDGSSVGPNLSGIGERKDRAYLLEALLAPGKTLAEGFETPSGVSVMPPMGDILTTEELRDLIAYLSEL